MINSQKINDLLRKYDKYLPRPSHYSFMMSANEQELFDLSIRDSKVYLEFGMGGSTFHALQKSSAKVYSIDSSREWIKLMREYWYIRFMELTRLSLIFADVGPVKEWGVPIGDNPALFPNYSAAIFKTIRKEKVDTVLVDGRFRVACTLKTILECHPNKNLQILIHDFWDRPHYHIVLRYLDAVVRADTLGVFELKKGIDLNAVRSDYEAYKYNFT
jgi:hypothetical protein